MEHTCVCRVWLPHGVQLYVFLYYFEEQWISDGPTVLIISRFHIEDTFLLFSSEFDVTKFLNYMNSKYRNIKFTVERQENMSLAFLDIKIFRDSGKFQTLIYRKPIFSGALTNFESFLPLSFKYNLVSILLHRNFMICFSYRTLHFEILNLKQIFRSNRYPQNFVDCCNIMYLDKVFIKHPNICVVPKKELVCVFPFVGKNPQKLKSDCKMLL